MGQLLKELSGPRFGHLLVNRYLFTARNGSKWECLCDCGELTVVSGPDLRNGHTRSCGHLRKTHGYTSQNNRTNGKIRTEYTIWNGIKGRCLNPKNKDYKNYGARGINIHPDWSVNFQTFLDYVGPRPNLEYQLDRIDNDGNYEPGNVRWVPKELQAGHRRKVSDLQPRLDAALARIVELENQIRSLQGNA